MLTAVKGNLKIMFLSIKYNLMKCMENNVAFATSVIMMIFNNATFIIQWLTIFAIQDTIGGYNSYLEKQSIFSKHVYTHFGVKVVFLQFLMFSYVLCHSERNAIFLPLSS